MIDQVKAFLLKQLTEVKPEDFFSNEEACYKLLADVKWADGYTCAKCGNHNYCSGKTPYSRRCTRCKSEESATKGTVFHNCKFPLNKAFYIAWHVCNKEELSTYEFARRLSLRQMTCWNFKTKICQQLGSMELHDVHSPA